jgi:hypothetical protein
MAVYTYTGNKRTADWAIKEITIGRNADGTPKTLKLGESADIDAATYKIYVTNQQDPILSNWMSGSFIFTPNSTFFQHRLRARIVGVG